MLLQLFAFTAMAQKQWTAQHIVQKKETIFGIAKSYSITIDELLNGNPDMKKAGFELKKGMTIFVPYAKPGDINIVSTKKTTSSVASASTAKTPVVAINRTIKLGVMLPLHNDNDDGVRMVEYYRGVLLACQEMQAEGISIDVRAWNLAIDADESKILQDPNAATCDIIIGPLYSSQLPALAEFTHMRNIRLVVPFSIVGNSVEKYGNVFQLYQSPAELNSGTCSRFASLFSGYHPVIINCNDVKSQKQEFTANLRQTLDAKKISYNITNVTTEDKNFDKAFSKNQPNIVVLNTDHSPQLTEVYKKLAAMQQRQPKVQVSMFGYTEWLMYTKYNLDKFFQFDTYIPSTFFYNEANAATKDFEGKYKDQFALDMLEALPRFALVGYDHARYFVKGFRAYGNQFVGSQQQRTVPSIQNPMYFKSAAVNGGFKNKAQMFIHYTPQRTIEAINY